MSGIVQLVKDNFDLVLKETYTDPVVDSWLLMGSPWPVLTITAFYLTFVLWLGPRIMSRREPFTLTHVLIGYNVFQVVANFWLCSRVFMKKGALDHLLNHGCYTSKVHDAHFRPDFHAHSWFYLMIKVIELLDTVFFVLRKKQSQVTGLHVYHHTNMLLSTWIFLKYIKGEQGALIGTLNSFVHVIMYTYYCLAALGPKVQKYLWWKRYITKLQLAQFVIVTLYLAALLAKDCSTPKGLSVYALANTVAFFIMFLNFYKSAYVKRSAKKSV